MGYSNVWSDSSPLGSAAANTIDDIIRSVKVDLEQRIGDLWALPLTAGVVSSATFATDPLRAYGIRFTDSQDAVIYAGDNSGTLRNILIKDKTGTTTYWTLSQTSLTGGFFKSNAGGVGLYLIPSASGTYGSAEVIEWFRADGTTARSAIGYVGNNTQVFTIGTGEAGGSVILVSDNNTTAITISSTQLVTFAKSAIFAASLVGASSIRITNGVTPNATPVGETYIYAESGASKGKGTSGTITTFAPA